jgi:pimeloyl-ACP methyl ester carboxylesterase
MGYRDSMAPPLARGKLLGHERVGAGPHRVLVLHDWLCDTSAWDGARAYLDGERFTWCFTDLRGYGRSRGRAGAFTCREAAGDLLALADSLSWLRFSIVSHSMSTLVALHVAQHDAERVERVVLLAPPPPGGFGMGDDALAASQATVRDEAARAAMIRARFAERFSPGWVEHKTARWLATSDAEAAAGYMAMFARDGLPDRAAKVEAPVLAITGELDSPPMRREAVQRVLGPICPRLEVVALEASGHYPMQEMPPLTVSLVERFLGAA